MAKFGGYLVFFAVASALLAMADRQFILMMWIDFLGPGAAWIARGIMVGIGLFLISRDLKPEDATLRPPGSRMT